MRVTMLLKAVKPSISFRSLGSHSRFPLARKSRKTQLLPNNYSSVYIIHLHFHTQLLVMHSLPKISTTPPLAISAGQVPHLSAGSRVYRLAISQITALVNLLLEFKRTTKRGGVECHTDNIKNTSHLKATLL